MSMTHYCYANRCKVKVPQEMLMCYKHWQLVPEWLKDKVWKSYQPGQFSEGYIKAISLAKDYVGHIELENAINKRKKYNRFDYVLWNQDGFNVRSSMGSMKRVSLFKSQLANYYKTTTNCIIVLKTER